MHQRQQPSHNGAMSEDYYINAQGLMVFTAAYHLKRGYCCGSGCKHCPYDKESTSEAGYAKPTSSTGFMQPTLPHSKTEA